MMTRLHLLGGLFLFAACEPQIVAEQSAIINGELAAAGEFPAVGALVFDFGGDFEQYCTGTLIAPNIVLSAAHCVDPALSGIDLDTTAAFTRVVLNQLNTNNGIQAGGIAARVEQIIMNNDFDANFLDQGNDVSVLILDQPVAGVEPIPVTFDNAAAFVGDRFTAVGYGVSNAANQSGSGVQRFTTFELEAAQGELNFYGTQNDTGTGVCFGDSGGPDLIEVNGELRVFGIHSFVFDGSTCLGGAGAQRTDTQEAFVQPILDEFAAPPPVIDGDEDGKCSVNPTSTNSASGAIFLLFIAGAFALRRNRKRTA
jgi:V8-like Glu-specific endopeptidase